MKTIHHVLGSSLVLLLAASGCASKPPPELRDARSAYEQATRTPGANLAQTDMHEARQALDRAEAKFADDGDEPETRDLAYVAKRRAQMASANASALASMEQARIAQEQKRQLQQRQAMATRQQLEQTKQELQMSQQQVQAERQARAAADKKAMDALAKLKGMEAREEARGLVLTLGGSVLFASGKSELLPAAQQQLAQVAKVLREDKRHVQIIGHTDSTGSDELNEALSKRRADAVKTFFTSHGVPEDRITTEGAGETQPVASNKTPEGRATNRRVEIILTGNVTDQGQQQQPGMQQPGMQQPGMQQPGMQQPGMQQPGMQQQQPRQSPSPSR